MSEWTTVTTDKMLPWMAWCQQVEDLVGEEAFLDTENNLNIHELNDKFKAGMTAQEVADNYYNREKI